MNGASLKEAIRRGQIVTVHRGTDGTHPTLVVEKVEDPADAGSSLTLDALKNVDAPANTPAGMFLGTTGVGAWGAVANPTAGLWPGKTRTSRPNVSDRLLEVWDGAAWIPVHYDSGQRDISSLITNGWTGRAYIRRIGPMVNLRLDTLVGTAATAMHIIPGASLPAPFRTPVGSPNFVKGLIGTGKNALPTMVISWTYGDGVYVASGSRTGINDETWEYLGPAYTVPYVPTSLPGTTVTTAP
jgi:hypothetical protein